DVGQHVGDLLVQVLEAGGQGAGQECVGDLRVGANVGGHGALPDSRRVPEWDRPVGAEFPGMGSLCDFPAGEQELLGSAVRSRPSQPTTAASSSCRPARAASISSSY